MKIRFEHIKELIQVRPSGTLLVSGPEMNILPTIKDAYLTIEDDKITDFGPMTRLDRSHVDHTVDVTGKMILPAWCDSHTHLVYYGNREGEFVQRIKGASYEDIANSGGGILNSAKKLQQASKEDILDQSEHRLREVIKQGTGAIEIKSGYGLTHEAEIKMLEVTKLLSMHYDLPIVSTFLAAHALPKQYENSRDTFIKSILEESIPYIAKYDLATYIDVFCEKGYFSVEEMSSILKAGQAFELPGKVHVNQFNIIGGVEAAVHMNARSVDHLEHLSDEDISSLKSSKTMPVALPACSMFLSIPYTPGRRMIDAGLPLAIASDYNPGSSPSGNMNLVVALSCIKMNLTPEEAINAATINGAYAMGLEGEVGSITVGKKANLIITKPVHSYNDIPYRFGDVLIDEVYISGKKFEA